jgi:hypothetical protein
MKFLLYIAVSSLFLLSCASYQNKAHETSKLKKNRQKVDHKIPRPVYGVMFDLVSDKEFELVFENVSSDHDMEIRLNRDAKLIPLKEGVWELTGIELQGNFYGLMSTSKKFTIQVSPKKIVYAGTYLLGCPVTDQSSTESLKKMKFFNRYELTSEKGSCELVVGDDWKTFRRKLIKKRKYKWLNSVIGF